MFKEIVKRYTTENENSNLSCGGNIQFLNLKPGEKILDLGCGRGAETMETAKLVGVKGFAWGIDITPRMIEIAKQAAQELKVTNVQFMVGSMDKLPLPDESVDAVISNCAINHVNNKRAVYQEIFRVLKPRGRFVVSDIMTETPLPLSIKQDPEAVANCFGGAITVHEYEIALRQAGFREVEILKERTYLKNGYPMISRTFQGEKAETN